MRMPSKSRVFAVLAMICAVQPGCKGEKSFPASSTQKALCGEHRLPDAECPFCHENLVKEMGECMEHAVPEALCWLCKPQLLDVFKSTNDWCGGHDRPESLCFICNPEREALYADILTSSTTTGPADAADAVVEFVAEADLPRTQRSPNVNCKTSQARVRLASTDVAKNAGLEISAIALSDVTITLSCNAEIVYNGNRFARVSSRVTGVVQEVVKDVGDRVTKGETLAFIDSAELAAARAEYLQALGTVNLWDQNHMRTHELVEKGIAGKQEDLEAEAKLAESKIGLSRTLQRLRTLGLSETFISETEKSQDTSPLLAVTAPFDGEIVARSAVIGELVDLSKPLFEVADTSKMWAHLAVYEADIAQVRTGQPVIVMVDGIRGESFSGKVTWISTQIDPRTRTLPVRVELDNPDGVLRANMFGRAVISVHDREPRLLVPKSAVQWDGCCNIAFVRRNELIYEPRRLRLGPEMGEFFVVETGLTEGETVVTQGSFMLKTEIMKSSIGAGCCEAGGKHG